MALSFVTITVVQIWLKATIFGLLMFATEGGMKERCNERKAQGKHYAIVLGALIVDRRLKI